MIRIKLPFTTEKLELDLVDRGTAIMPADSLIDMPYNDKVMSTAYSSRHIGS
jgi:hypothetical protein